MQSEQPQLRTVAGELRVLVASLSKPRMAGQRLTRKRAEIATLLALYREVLLILGRIETGLRKLERLQRDVGKVQTISAARLATMPNLVLDVKALYHWTYTIENFLKQVAPELSRDELSRIGIFRHKLIVHHAETPMRARRGVPSEATAFGPRAERFRIISHPLFQSAPVWRGLVRKIGQLNPYVPGLKEQQNLWEKVNLIYRHFNSIPDGSKGSLRNWVRNDLFGSVGLTSDPPAVIAHALLVALQEYKRKRHV